MRIEPGLSETSSSLNDGGVGSGEAAKRPMCLGRGQRRQRGAAGRRRPAHVRGEERDPHEERLSRGRAAAHDLDGLVCVDVRLVRRRVPPVLHERPVLVDRVAVELVRGVVDRAVPLRPAGRDLVLVEVAVSVQVLADVDRLVARALEPDGKGVLVVQRVVAAVGRLVREHAVVVGVLAGEEGGAGRAAERERREAVVEGRSLGDEQPLDVLHDADRLDGLVVGHDHDDVRPLRRPGMCSRCADCPGGDGSDAEQHAGDRERRPTHRDDHSTGRTTLPSPREHYESSARGQRPREKYSRFGTQPRPLASRFVKLNIAVTWAMSRMSSSLQPASRSSSTSSSVHEDESAVSLRA